MGADQVPPPSRAPADPRLLHVEGIAETEEEEIRICRIHRQRADGRGPERVGERVPLHDLRRRGTRAVGLPHAAAGGRDVEDVGIERVGDDLADAAGVDLLVAIAIHREVRPGGPEADERASRHAREAADASRRADRVAVALAARRLEHPCPAAGVRAVPLAGGAQARGGVVPLDFRGRGERKRRDEADQGTTAHGSLPKRETVASRSGAPKRLRPAAFSRGQAAGRRNRERFAGSAASAGNCFSGWSF